MAGGGSSEGSIFVKMALERCVLWLKPLDLGVWYYAIFSDGRDSPTW
jgi:hypothetical protein